MGFEKRSISFARFCISETKTPFAMDLIRNLLLKYAFVPLDSPEPVKGCVGCMDITDTTFTFDPVCDPWILFGIRTDVRSVPGSLIKVKTKEKILENEKKGIQVSRAMKKEFRDEVELQLKAKALPNPSMKCVAWNFEENEIWYEGTSSKLQDEFLQFFSTVFDVPLESITPEFLARKWFPEKDNEISNLSTFSLGQNESEDESLDDCLSKDFMLWLWYQSVHDNLHVSDVGGTEFTVSVDSSITLANNNGNVSLFSEAEDENFVELKNGLQEYNRTVSKVSLLYTDEHDNVWKAKLSLGSITPTGIKKPKIAPSIENVENDEAKLLIELDLAKSIISITDALYKNFLSLRLDSNNWNSFTKQVFSWIAEN